jgi:hypothetical protein
MLAFGHRLVRKRRCGEFGGAKGAALIALGDRIGVWRLGRQYRFGISLGIVLRPIAKAIGVRIVVP